MTRFLIVISLTLACALLALACGGEGGGVVEIQVPTGFGGVINQGQALVFSASGLGSGEFPVLVEALTESGAVASQARLTADREGRILDVVLAYDTGLSSVSGNGQLAPGVHSVRLTAAGGTVEIDVTVADSPTGPRVWACDISGELANAFPSGEPVFVAAEGLEPGATYRVWPVADRRAWSDGDVFKSWQAEKPMVVWPPEIPEYIEVTADVGGVGGVGGVVAPTQLLPYATKFIPGVTDQFDIVLDAEPFGVFNMNTDAVDAGLPTGVVIQDPAGDGSLIAELASRADYTYTNNFQVGEPVYVWLNPGMVILDPHAYVLKYILLHRIVWADGTDLQDLTEGVELDVVQFGCSNEGLILAWLLAELGKYDVIIDMNANGIYDEGIDILDGGPSGPGFTVTE